MIRYLWAADRMWEGLPGPSDGACNHGPSQTGSQVER